MFIAIFGVIARAASLFLGVMKIDEHLTRSEKAKIVELLDIGSGEPKGTSGRWLNLRRWSVVALILLVFSFEILFLDPNDVRRHLALQSLLLLSIALYQSSFYREFSKDSYAWGLLYGKWYVQCVRSIYGVGPGFVAAILIVGNVLAPYAFKDYPSHTVTFVLHHAVRPIFRLAHLIQSTSAFWICGAVVMLFLSFAALFVTLSTENLKWLSDNGKAQRPTRSWVLKGIFLVQDSYFLLLHAAKQFLKPGLMSKGGDAKIQWLSAIDCFFFPVATGWYCWLTLRLIRRDDSVINARFLSLGTLVLALIVLSNLFVILAMRHDRTIDLGLKPHSPDKATELLQYANTWLLRVVMFGTLYMVSILGFAYRIYPFIPVQKAGGNYSTADAVNVHLTEVTAACSSRDLDSRISPTVPYIVLQEDENWVYLAPESGPGSAGGPECWKWGAFCHSTPPSDSGEAEQPYRPKVYTVNRHCIASTESISPNQPD